MAGSEIEDRLEAQDRAVEEILAEADAKLWAGIEARVYARIHERDRRLAARLREIDADLEREVQRSPDGDMAAIGIAGASLAIARLADILEAGDG